MHGCWCEDIFLVDLHFGVKKRWRLGENDEKSEHDWEWGWSSMHMDRWWVGFTVCEVLISRGFWASEPPQDACFHGAVEVNANTMEFSRGHGWKIIDDFSVWLPAISLQTLKICSSVSSSQFFKWFTSKKRDPNTPNSRHIPWVFGSSLTSDVRVYSQHGASSPAGPVPKIGATETRWVGGCRCHVWCKEIQGVNPMNSKFLMVVNGL